MLAAVKAGMKIVEIDISINSIHDLREALKLANCKAIYFEPVTETQDNLLLLRKAIPEFYHCKIAYISIFIKLSVIVWKLFHFVDDDAQGQFFHSKYYPNLKFFVQTGFDYEQGSFHSILPP